MPADPRRVKDLFAAALDLPSADRPAFLDRECGGDAELRRRLDVLLAALDKPHPALEQPLPAPSDADDGVTRTAEHVGDGETADHPGSTDTVGTLVAGRYKLLEVIGEGGMGTVWMAEQREPVKRLVAAKLIKAGMDSRAVLARFEAERQALALMDHPNIAKVLDGGTTAEGRPFFVMELVKGLPLTEYCDARRLSVRDRLELFRLVCSAVQHAHQKGVIHRDLKPSNVLVTEHDGKPVPKVIDFGLAKALAATNVLTDKTLHTAFGAVVGTPLYMAPEQVGINALDVDTRTDLYALGVILYELLTGTTPLVTRGLRAAGWHARGRMIRAEEPPRPSVRLSSSDALPSLAAGRQSEPARLTKLVRGELDWIVMKALEKDRNRRYETANGLAMDVQRHLTGEPVQAVPPSTAYRLKKFARRNRPQVIAASVVLVTLSVGVVGTALGLVEAKRQERIARDEAHAKEVARQAAAERAEGERAAKLDAKAKQTEAERARTRAEEAKRVAQAVRDFMRHKLLNQADVRAQAYALSAAGGTVANTKVNPTIRELLDRAAEELTPDKIESNFPNEPLVQSGLLQTVGETYRGVGEFERAVGFLERSAAVQQAHQGADHPDTLAALSELAWACHEAGHLPRAIELAEKVRDVRTAKLGADHLDALDALNLLAWLHQESGQLAQALELFEKVHTVRAARLGADDLNTIMSLHNLAWACMRVGRASRAVELLQKVRDVQAAKLGGDHPDTLVTLHNLALAYRDDGQAPRAIELFEKTHGLQTGRLGAEHPQTLITLHNLACAYVRTGHPERAIPAFEDVLNRQEGKLGRQHPHTLMSLNWLASAYNDAGQYTKARERAEEALARLRADRVPEQLDALGTFRVLAGVLRDRGNLAGSIEVNRLLLEAFRRKLGRVDRTTIDTENHLGLALVMDGRYPEAEAHLLASYRNLPQAANVPAGWKSLYALRLACLYTEWGKPASVARWQDEVRSLVGQYSRPLVGTGLEMFQAARFRAAELAFRECLTIRERTEPDAWPTFNARSLLGGSLLAQGKYTEAEPLLLKGYEGMKAREKTIPPQATTRVPEALDRLIDLYTATGKPDEAKKWRAERAKYPFVAPPPRAVR